MLPLNLRRRFTRRFALSEFWKSGGWISEWPSMNGNWNECSMIWRIMCCCVLYVLATVRCPALNVSNSVLNTTNSNFSTVVRIVCNFGYAIDPLNLLNNSANSVCTSSGNWSTFPITCQRELQWFSLGCFTPVCSRVTSKYIVVTA